MAATIEILPSHHRKNKHDFELKDVDLSKIDNDLTEHLLGLEQKVEKAINRAIRKLAAWLRTHSVREIGKQLNIKQATLRSRYRFSDVGGKNGYSRRLKIWVGLLAVAAHNAGIVKQNAAGSTVRGRQFDSAFKARIYGDQEKMYIRSSANRQHRHTTITEDGYDWSARRRASHLQTEQNRKARFKAEYGGRFPVQVVGIDIADVAQDVLERYESRLNARYRELLSQELNYALDVET